MQVVWQKNNKYDKCLLDFLNLSYYLTFMAPFSYICYSYVN